MAELPHPLIAALLLWDAKTTRANLSVSDRTLWRITNCNALPCRRIGRSVRYDPREVAAWVAAGCPTTPNSGDAIREAVTP